MSPSDYVADLYALESVAAAFKAFSEPAAYPAYFPCAYGRDRTGVLAAVLLIALGASQETVLAEYELSAAAGLTTYPQSLVAALAEIDKQGGIEPYLASAGVSGEALAALRT